MSAQKKTLPAEKIIFKACFEQIAARGLGKTRLSALAKDLNVPVTVLYPVYPSIESILLAFCAAADRHMLEQCDINDLTAPKRDQYFDLLMARFDFLQAHRAGVKRWLQELPQHPALLAKILCRWNTTISLALDITRDSPLFAMKRIGLAAIHLATLKAWMADDSADMTKTMAALDKALGRGQVVIDKIMTKKKAA